MSSLRFKLKKKKKRQVKPGNNSIHENQGHLERGVSTLAELQKTPGEWGLKESLYVCPGAHW